MLYDPMGRFLHVAWYFKPWNKPLWCHLSNLAPMVRPLFMSSISMVRAVSRALMISHQLGNIRISFSSIMDQVFSMGDLVSPRNLARSTSVRDESVGPDSLFRRVALESRPSLITRWLSIVAIRLYNRDGCPYRPNQNDGVWRENSSGSNQLAPARAHLSLPMGLAHW